MAGEELLKCSSSQEGPQAQDEDLISPPSSFTQAQRKPFLLTLPLISIFILLFQNTHPHPCLSLTRGMDPTALGELCFALGRAEMKEIY